MTLQIGDLAPDFEADSTEGRIRFHNWIGDSWVVLLSHPKDFTVVCTTELSYLACIKPEFDKRNTKVIGLSVDPLDSYSKSAADITQGVVPKLSDDRRYRSCRFEDLGHAARKFERRLYQTRCGRQSDRAQRLRHRAG